MADNLKITERDIDTAIDPNAGIGGIRAVDHNAVLKQVLKKAGKYAPIFYTAKGGTSGTAPTGTFLWNGNPFNKGDIFTVRFAKKSNDLNDVGHFLDLMAAGSLIFFKDMAGRTAVLEYQGHSPANDGANYVYDVQVKGKPDNSGYTYQATEAEVCGFGFLPKAVSGHPEYTITVEANLLKLKRDGSEVGSVDLSLYLDDTNLARIVSGSLDTATGMATFVRDDDSTFSLDLSGLVDGYVDLTGEQTVSGRKTFSNAFNLFKKIALSPQGNHSGLNGTTAVLGYYDDGANAGFLMNPKGTSQPFILKSANTAFRQYGFQNRDGTVAFLDDVPVTTVGTWTPVLNGTPAYSVPNGFAGGRYVRTGNLIYVTCSIFGITSSGTATGLLSISGLPFAPKVTGAFLDVRVRGAVSITDSGSVVEERDLIAWTSTSGSGHIEISDRSRPTNALRVTFPSSGTDGRIDISGMYEIN